MENCEQVHHFRRSLLTPATLARYDSQQLLLHPHSFLCLYFPCLPLSSIWPNLTSVLANPLGWTRPCQTWIHQSLSTRGREGEGGRNRGMSGGKRGGAVGVKYSHQSTQSHLIFLLSKAACLPLQPQETPTLTEFGVSCQVARRTLRWF